MITVFTPSYNRKKELSILYSSLLNQEKDIFEWLIIDDGSSDDTKEYITKLKKEANIKINYIYKENGGKQSAYNVGLSNAKGDIFLCIDSDDILKDNILKEIKDDFTKIKDNPNIAGLVYLQGYINNKDKIIGTDFPEDNLETNYFDLYHKFKVTGDKLIILKTSVAKEYYFPLIKGEKFVPEALIFNRISKKYNFLCLNKVASYKEYLEGGYSSNYFNLVKRNPLSNRLYFKELYLMEKTIYNVYGYILFSIYGKVKFNEMLKEHPAKILIIILYLPVLFVSKIRK